ncbi:hypothetical protein RB195_021600 [Necator americanus]|uniref:Uncharacterized protein n=1 Tax=Necator americanus TaxID=51031 RepID=A0ABR1EBX5_NECAM
MSSAKVNHRDLADSNKSILKNNCSGPRYNLRARAESKGTKGNKSVKFAGSTKEASSVRRSIKKDYAKKKHRRATPHPHKTKTGSSPTDTESTQSNGPIHDDTWSGRLRSRTATVFSDVSASSSASILKKDTKKDNKKKKVKHVKIEGNWTNRLRERH